MTAPNVTTPNVTTPEELYIEVKPDIAALVEPLLGFSEMCIRKQGNFLPHGAVLPSDSKAVLVAAAPEVTNDVTTSTAVLPLVHDALRAQAKETSLVAVGVAENVTITPQGKARTRAIKVLLEHKRGLVVALYLPFKKRFLRGYTFGEVFSVGADAEVDAWGEAKDE